MLRFVDSFDHYTGSFTQKYDAVQGAVQITSGGRNGSRVQVNDGGTPGWIQKTLDSQPTWIIGFALMIGAYSGASKQIFELLDAATIQVTLYYQNSTQKLYLNGPFGSDVGDTVIVAGAWYYVELKITIGNAGSYELRINEQTELSAAGVDTQASANATADIIRLRGGDATVSSQVRYFDDLYVCDATGGVNDDFRGDCRVEALFPNGNGNSSQLVGSDGNSTDNYLLVDESPPNADTDYVESATVTNKDTYAMGDLSAAAGTVYGVQAIPYARKTDAGSRRIKSVARLSATDVDGAEKNLLDGFKFYPHIYETKPGGGSWTISDVNSAEFGMKVSA